MVGKGGYAVVHRAIRIPDRAVVAVKKVDIFELSEKKRDRCLQEVQLLRAMAHPNVITLLDAFVEDNILVIIFEWAGGGDLKRIIGQVTHKYPVDPLRLCH